MTDTRINSDLSRRVLVDTAALPWIPSPQAGVDRRLLDRIGGEVARATSIVRYAPAGHFPAHVHARGEEFLVLEGVFSDEHGDYPAGTYVRNPPGSAHTPRSAGGCTIFVKLRQMDEAESTRVVLGPDAAMPGESPAGGIATRTLHVGGAERVSAGRADAGAALDPVDDGGFELLLLSGEMTAGGLQLRPGAWLRCPPGERLILKARRPSTYWMKQGHLGDAGRTTQCPSS